jgi:hypothetical protein
MLVADHLNKVEIGIIFLTSPEPRYAEDAPYIFPDKAAISLVCMGFGLKRICELCLSNKI